MNSVIIVLFAVVGMAAAYPRPPYGRDYRPYPVDKPYYAPRPYDFGYETKDDFGGVQNRHESSDGQGGVKGSYGYVDPWGVSRQVDYVADEHGYRAKVRTNEPGTANQDPANVLVDANPVHGQVRPLRPELPRPRKPFGPHGPY